MVSSITPTVSHECNSSATAAAAVTSPGHHPWLAEANVTLIDQFGAETAWGPALYGRSLFVKTAKFNVERRGARGRGDSY